MEDEVYPIQGNAAQMLRERTKSLIRERSDMEVRATKLRSSLEVCTANIAVLDRLIADLERAAAFLEGAESD